MAGHPRDSSLTPAQKARFDIREGHHTGHTRGLAMGFVQCNLVILHKSLAYDFLLYCQRNQKACPVLEVTDTGDPEPKRLAPGADLRSDLPRYAVYRKGKRLEDINRIHDLWSDDSVGFLIGSGITFDQALERAGVPTDKHRWVLNSNIPTEPAGPFKGNMAVTMRWLTPEQAVKAVQVTSRFPFNHGAPVHMGDPVLIGADLANPLFGPPVEEAPPWAVPVFWACGVTPQQAALAAGIELMVTHSPAHGFITDLLADRFCLP